MEESTLHQDEDEEPAATLPSHVSEEEEILKVNGLNQY